MACDYSSAKEALRLGTSSATAGAQGLHDMSMSYQRPGRGQSQPCQ